MAEYIEFEATKQAIDRIRSVYHRARNYNAVSAIDNVFGEIVDEVPAADVAPVVHGHWRKSKEGVCGDYLFVCSACGADYWESPSYYKQAHYCPNCGAKMDEN